uniref:BTB/POZ domain-containing protein KCTD19 n=1 Tax=Anas zonorhyncha TaxID=75864 RepID=A0A8B9V2L0_9AVES
MQTSKVSFFSCDEFNLLYEQALIFQLTPLVQILDNSKEEKHDLCVRPADIPVAQRTSPSYWRTRKSTSKPSEVSPKIKAFTGLHESAPLGLVDTPLLDTEEEVNYCFLPLDLVRKYPVLVNDDNLLWLLENAVLIECGCSEFRFIVNFLRSEKLLLPDDFSSIDVLEEEVLLLGIHELIDALRIYRGCSGALESPSLEISEDILIGAGRRRGAVGRWAPLFCLALGLLSRYPDSVLGQLRMSGDRRRLHVCGTGSLFQHARNWLGTCQLPLTENISEIQELCAYLDKMDSTYEPMKDALKCYLKQQMPSGNWTAEVSACSLHQIVKVYVGSNWYETYLQTLLKYPELLSNDKKVCWITYGQSLLIHGDGQMFRHVLNFLRLGKLFLPTEFKEWPLFCQEAEEYQIPSLLEALYHCDAYRLWIQSKELHNEGSFPCRRLDTESWNKEHEFRKQDTNGEKAKCSKMVSWARGTKRKNTLGEDEESSHSMVNSSLLSASPPRKREISSLTKTEENEDSATHIQKLLSLVKEWDMVNSKRCDSQHVKISDGCITGSVSQYNTPENDRGVKASIACSPGKISFTTPENSPITQCEAGAEGKQLDQYVLRQKTMDSKQTPVLLEDHRNVGLILKVEHPPVLGSDGFHTCNEESVVYSILLDGTQLGNSSTQALPKDIVFLRFSLSREEIFYARKCHFFLTDVILDSIRQKDPKEITAKIMTLVNRLWTQQLTPKEFVADLLNTEHFKQDRKIREELLQWVEFTLPFAWKYSRCLDLLIERGLARSVSYFALEM